MKRSFIVIMALLVVCVAGVIIGGTLITKNNQPTFDKGGYVLEADKEGVTQHNFAEGTRYSTKKTGVTFKDDKGNNVSSDLKNFVHYSDGSVMSFSDGIMLDLNDLSDNFINNYYLTSGVTVAPKGNGEYSTETDSGTVDFGENIWKLSDTEYIVQSPELTVHLSDGNEKIVTDYVQVSVSEDGIVRMLTPENAWSTVSDDCYIKTADGVQIYPRNQIVANQTYQMSLAKLSVSPDDSIVLTDDELRKQIVPEITVEAIDGKDGDNGTAGEDGTGGTSGDDGEDGEKGKKGDKGDGGTDQLGANPGTDAVSDSSTNSGLPQMQIPDLTVTGRRIYGRITVNSGIEDMEIDVETDKRYKYAAHITVYEEESGKAIPCYSTNSEYDLPSATDDPNIYDFLDGNDEVFFTSFDGVLEPGSTYRLVVTAYYMKNTNVYSREFINKIFYTDSAGIVINVEEMFTNSLNIHAEVPAESLQSITKAEVFVLTQTQAKTFSITDTKDTAKFVEKITLDYSTNEMSLTSSSKTEIILDKDGNPKKPGTDMILEFPDLSVDTNYIIKSAVMLTSDSYVSKQELSTRTLKENPTWTGKPTAYYNRVDGAIQVYRPTIVDNYGGMVSYTYTCYDSTGAAVIGKPKTVTANTSDPVQFNLPNGTYVFGITAKFNDNQKDITFDLGKSDAVTSQGDTLPKVTLEKNDDLCEYNKMVGKLVIQLTGSNTTFVVDNSHPLELNIYADQIYDTTISLTNGESVTKGSDIQAIYKATLDYTVGSNYAYVELDLSNLLKNTNFTISVSGYLDLNTPKEKEYEDKEFIKRSIGTASFRTASAPQMQAVFTDVEKVEVGTVIAKHLYLTLYSYSSEVPKRQKLEREHTLTQLTNGSLKLSLYSGIGGGKQFITSTVIDSNTKYKVGDTVKSTLDSIYRLNGEDGYTITTADFNDVQLTSGCEYTLTVTELVDQSQVMYDQRVISYVNAFDTPKGNTTIVTANTTSPDLIKEPTQGITVTPILNKKAGIYGKDVDQDLPDDCVVGYKLHSNYDNSGGITNTVTYYAMEFSDFYDKIVNGDGINDRVDPVGRDGSGPAKKLMTMTVPVDATSSTVPEVAVFFGGEKSTEPEVFNGKYVYNAGPISMQPGLVSGMDRGFRYIFAYTANFDLNSGSTGIYPYDNADYAGSKKNYKNAYGAGQFYGKYLGNADSEHPEGVAYILNSGIVEAPKMDPEFYSYIYETTVTSISDTTSQGLMTIRYKYHDNDSTLVVSGDMDNRTKIYYYNNGNKAVKLQQAITENEIEDDWHYLTVQYTTSNSDSIEDAVVIEPTIGVSTYRLDYDCMEALWKGTEEEEVDRNYYLCHAPVDFAWGKLFNENAQYSQAVIISREDHLADNYIMFRLKSNISGSSDVVDTLANRAYALVLTFKSDDGTVTLGPLSYALSTDYIGPYVKIPTGRLAALVGLNYTCSAYILFDDGNMGWRLINEEVKNRYSIQYINGNTSETKNVYGLYGYLGGASDGTSGKALKEQDKEKTKLDIAKLQETVEDVDNRFKRAFNLKGITTGEAAYTYYCTISNYGVDLNQDQLISSLSGRYCVPKSVDTYNLLWENGTDKGRIDYITPSITKPVIYTTTTTASLSGTNIMGFKSAIPEKVGDKDVYKAYAYVYTDEDKAKALSLLPTDIKKSLIFTLDDKGNIPDYTMKDLSGGDNYWIVYWMWRLDDEGNPTRMILKDASTANNAVYAFQTISGVKITFDGVMVYTNESYFTKEYRLDFRTTRATGFKMSYDILDAEGNVEIIGNDELTKSGGILSAPGKLTNTANKLILSMTPALERSKLVPGTKYTLRLRCWELTDDMTEPENKKGEAITTFTIPSAWNYGAYIFSSDASKDSVTFQVTINDEQHSFMGFKGSYDDNSLYKVRFTDADGNRLVTDYDSQVFRADEFRKVFVLSNEHLSLYDKDKMTPKMKGQEILPDSDYYIEIYAIIDDEHDGYSNPTNKDQLDLFKKGSTPDKTGETWEYFTKIIETEGITKFDELLNSFWYLDTVYKKTTDAKLLEIEAGFLVGEKKMSTTGEDGLYVNEANALYTRSSSSTQIIQLQLAESFGLIDNDNQTFKKIVWSVNGATFANKIVKESGIVLESNDEDTLFVKVKDKAGYDIYMFDIPKSINNGRYTVSVALFKNEDDITPYCTISRLFVG